MTTKDNFTTFKVSKALKIEYGRLREWIDNGFVVPSVKKAGGIGTKNLFSRKDVYCVRLFIHIIERGFSRKEAANMIKSFKKHNLLNLPTVYIQFIKKADGKTDVIIDEDQSKNVTFNLPKDCLDVYILNYSKLQEQVDMVLE